MRWHLKTRSRNRDYQFIGGSPDRWWAPFGSDTSFERNTLLLETDESKRWRILVSGIPSHRLDRHHTLIRYTLVGEGDCGEASDLPLRLVTAFLQDARRSSKGGSSSTLGESFDALFNEETIEDWFSDDPSASELRLQAETLVQLALNKLPPTDLEPNDDHPTGSWFGSLHAPSCAVHFTERSRRLMTGDLAGACYCLNLADRPEDLGVDVSTKTIALLFDVNSDDEELHSFDPSSVTGAKKKGRPTQQGRTSRPPSSRSPKQASLASPRPSASRAPDDTPDAPRPERDVDPQPLVESPTPAPVVAEEIPSSKPEPRRILLTDEKTGETVETTEEEIAAILARRGIPPQVIRGLRDASHIVVSALDVGRGTFEGVRGTIRKTMSESFRTLESGMKEVSTVVREGASQGAREVFEAVKSMKTTADGELEGDVELGAVPADDTMETNRKPTHLPDDDTVEEPEAPQTGEGDDEDTR